MLRDLDKLIKSAETRVSGVRLLLQASQSDRPKTAGSLATYVDQAGKNPEAFARQLSAVVIPKSLKLVSKDMQSLQLSEHTDLAPRLIRILERFQDLLRVLADVSRPKGVTSKLKVVDDNRKGRIESFLQSIVHRHLEGKELEFLKQLDFVFTSFDMEDKRGLPPIDPDTGEVAERYFLLSDLLDRSQHKYS